MDAQREALAAGSEIEPPWIVFPSSEPWYFNQGHNEDWQMNIFIPFWNRLSREEQIAYVEKWEAPPSWHDTLLNPSWSKKAEVQKGETEKPQL